MPFRWTLVTYLLLTLSYSFWLKGVVLLDVVLLAGLYTLRIIAGGTATVISLKRVGSKWRLKCVYRGNRGRPAQLSILCRDGFHGLWRNSFPRSAPTQRDKKKYW